MKISNLYFLKTNESTYCFTKKKLHLDNKFLKYILAKYMGFVSLCIKRLWSEHGIYASLKENDLVYVIITEK